MVTDPSMHGTITDLSTFTEVTMRTHTIRNKNSNRPIVTLTPEFREMMVAALPQASSLAMGWFRRYFKFSSGKDITFDYDTVELMSARYDDANNDRGMEITGDQNKVMAFFEQGFLNNLTGMTFDEALRIASIFYESMLKVFSEQDGS